MNVTLQMPVGQYGENRGFAFDMLAKQYEVRELTLRNALSNVFVSMARLGQRPINTTRKVER